MEHAVLAASMATFGRLLRARARARGGNDLLKAFVVDAIVFAPTFAAFGLAGD